MKFDDVGLVVSFSLAQSFSLSTLLGKVKRSVSQCPHSRILIEGGGVGGPTEVHILHQKNPNFRIILSTQICHMSSKLRLYYC